MKWSFVAIAGLGMIGSVLGQTQERGLGGTFAEG